MEIISSVGHLETAYYVTDVKQMTDFAWYRGSGRLYHLRPWYRSSGVRLNIAARDINLVPTCCDVICAIICYIHFCKSLGLEVIKTQRSLILHYLLLLCNAAFCINLVPTYYDVFETGNDNAFVLTNPDASPADVTRFNDVIRRYCRSVITTLCVVQRAKCALNHGL